MENEHACPALDGTSQTSLLDCRFGKETVNYFSGSPLNRVSFLRDDHSFLSLALNHPSASFVLLDQLRPLVNGSGELAFVEYRQVKSIVGQDPYETPVDVQIADFDSAVSRPQLLFLGLRTDKDGLSYKDTYTGVPFFALDVTPDGHYKDEAERLIADLKASDWNFCTDRVALNLPHEHAAIFAGARHVMDWNKRNRFCSTCGNRTLSISAGFKRTCPPLDKARPASEPTECQTRSTISNVSFPRTDPTIIASIVSADGTKVLVGRMKRYPPGWYSTLAGFLEPGESVEEAVRREIWEESGVHVGRVIIHSTQPWPYPANLMIGAIGQAVAGGEEISLGHDKELDDAKWISLDELRTALGNSTAPFEAKAGPDEISGAIRLPPKTAIANRLMTAALDMFSKSATRM